MFFLHVDQLILEGWFYGISLKHRDAIKADHNSLYGALIFTSATDLADKAMITLFEVANFLAQEDIAILKL